MAKQYTAMKYKAARKGDQLKSGTDKDIIDTVKRSKGVTANISSCSNRCYIHRISLKVVK